MTLPAGSAIGKYVVRRKLAEGGMAEIYLCAVRGPEGFEKEVVIKRIRSFLASDPGFVQMFIAEARLASQLNHANIVQIFDFDKHEDTYYLAMEYIHGRSLWEVRRRASEMMIPMRPILAAHIAAEVARGLNYAHRLTDQGRPVGLVHRDVTPHNVLVSFDGAVKLTDFGIAKGHNKHTAPGMLKGKFAYMSPEQARGEEVDARTDLFALGIVLWEMLTGARLFGGDTEVAVLRSVQQSIIAPPARLNPDVPTALDELVMKALSREPEGRFQTAQEMERALAQFILSHASSVDETDVPGYLRQLFGEEVAPGYHVPVPQEQAAKQAALVPVHSKREPTAVLGGHDAPAQPAPAPEDEDLHAATFITGRKPAAVVPAPLVAASSAPSSDSELAPPSPLPRPERPSSRVTVRLDGPPFRTERSGSRWWVLGLGLLAMGAGSAATARWLWPSGEPAASASVDAGAVAEVVDLDHGEVPAEPPLEEAALDGGSESDAPVEEQALPPPVAEVDVAEPKRPGSRKGTGTLVVRAVPWAHLYIDGRPYGEVVEQRRFIKLSAGNHRVVFKHQKRTQSILVQIEPGRESFREYTLPLSP